jgi:hypothetical protein
MAAISLKPIYIDFHKPIKPDAAKPLTKKTHRLRVFLRGRLDQSRHHSLRLEVGGVAQLVG